MTNDIMNEIRKQVAGDIRLTPQKSGKIRIGTPLLYDDGDACSFFLETDRDASLFLTDLGDVLFRAGYADVDLLSDANKARVDRTMAFFGVSEVDGNIVMPVHRNGFSDAIFTFAQASLELVRLANLPSEKKKKEQNKFNARFRKLITKVVPSDRLEQNWHHPEHDPNGYYPVDFRIISPDKDWYVFGVGSETKCLRATVSCQAHKMHADENFSSLAIYRNKSSLRERDTTPLDSIVDEKFSDISNTDQIAGFIENQILKKAS